MTDFETSKVCGALKQSSDEQKKDSSAEMILTASGELVDDKDVCSKTESVRQMVYRALADKAASLTPREQTVLSMHFGFEDGRSYSLEEIERATAVPIERLRQIEARALRKIRLNTCAK